MQKSKSRNHVCWSNGFEMIHGETKKYVFAADPDDPIECTGNREHALFKYTVKQWNKTEMGKIFTVI